MGKKNKIKTPAADYPVPQEKPEAVRDIGKIGQLQRQRTRIETAMNDKLAKIKEEYEAKAAPLSANISALAKGVHTWCEANRDELTDNNKVKFANLPTGKVNWRKKPPKVNLSKVEDVIARLEKLGLTQFIRTKPEVDKEAILKTPDLVEGIKGIKVKSDGEEFGITPFETELEEIA